MARGRNPVIAALDIGTTKICALLAEPVRSANGALKIRRVAHGVASSAGMHQAKALNIEDLANAIYSAVRTCLNQAPQRNFDNIYVGIAGNHVLSKTVKLSIDIDPGRGVRDSDINRLLKQASKQLMDEPVDSRSGSVQPSPYRESDYQLSSCILNGFWLDQDFIPEASGLRNLRGRTLSVELHGVFANKLTMENIQQAIRLADLNAKEFVPESYASSLAVLEDVARENGAIVLDMGGGTTDIAVFYGKRLLFTGAVPYGGDIITKDLQRVLNTTHDVADQLKIQYGANPNRFMLDTSPNVEVYDVALRRPRSHPKSYIFDIIEARVVEILADARRVLEASGVLEKLPNRIVVITGGGALLDGIDILAERIIGVGAPPMARVQAVVAKPIIFTGHGDPLDSPVYSTVAGLAYHGATGSSLSSLPAHRTNWLRHVAGWWQDLFERIS